MEGGFVENVQVTGTVIYRGTTGDYTGGVVGDVGYSPIWRTSFTGAITSDSKNVGGIAGGIYPGGDMILDCYDRGDIAGLDSVGGILGVASQGGGIRNVWFRGNVTGTYAGGVVGLLYGTVADSYAGGTVTGAFLWGRIAGGMTDAGIIDNSYGEGPHGTVRGVGPYTYGNGYGAVVNGSALVPTLANIFSCGSPMG